ncbi:unnamed protein product [Brassica rapa subsp. narinosa]
MVVGDTVMSASRKLRLCLIIIVDGVLVPTSQKQNPSLKHVNLVKNLKKFLAFQWGRKSFSWAIRTMNPVPKLVAFELIPQLLKQARGDDSTTLLTFPGQVLPQHAGLTVVDLRKAEHDVGLVVQPMMEISGTDDERWAAWDDEKYDKKKDNMLGMIKSGHVFSKGDWGSGDGGDPIYKHREKVNAKKQKATAHVGVTEEPVLKQRHVSGYFRRGAMVDAEQYRRMEADVQELVLEVQQLKNVVEKQGRKFEKWKTFGYYNDDDSVKDDVPAFSAGGTQGEGDVRTPEQSSRSISEDRPDLLVRLPPRDGVPLQRVEPGSGDKVVYRAVHSQTFFVHSEEEGSSVGGGSRDQGGSGDGLDASAMADLDALVLAASGDMAGGRQSEETRVGTEAEKKEENPDGAEAMGEQPSVTEAGRKQEGQSGGTDGCVATCLKTRERFSFVIKNLGLHNSFMIVGALAVLTDFLENLGTVAGLGEANKVVIETEEKAEKPEGAGEKGEQLSEAKSGWTDGLGDQGVSGPRVRYSLMVLFVGYEQEGKAEEMGEELRVENENDESDSQVGDSEDAEITGVGPKTVVLDVSDTSDGGRAARHEPVEQEGELAAVLLAKDQYITPGIVPTAEDCDYAYFERVLLANLKVMHTSAGGYDLDNEFFINLATPCKWVSSTHMDVLADYVGRLHAEDLRGNRAMLVAPWFSAHLEVKERSFKAARRKTRIATDLKLTKFLTREGKKWGVDVDMLYAPMIWGGRGGDHWVGLCIRLATWDILVFDPSPRLKTEDEVASMMEPVRAILPYLAKKHAVGEHQLAPFHVERVVEQSLGLLHQCLEVASFLRDVVGVFLEHLFKHLISVRKSFFVKGISVYFGDSWGRGERRGAVSVEVKNSVITLHSNSDNVIPGRTRTILDILSLSMAKFQQPSPEDQAPGITMR